MKDNMKAAIVAAVNAYMQEEVKEEAPPSVVPIPMFSPWRVFGLQELMRTRTSMQKKVRQ